MLERLSRRKTSLWLPSTVQGGLKSDVIEVVSGSGVWVQTRSHGKMLDANSGLWHLSLGYGPTAAVEAASRAMKMIGGSSLFRRSHQFAECLSEMLASRCGPGDYLMQFATSGSEAVDAAIRLAFAYGVEGGRSTVAYVSGSYHGVSLGPLSLLGLDGYRNGCPQVIGTVELPGPVEYSLAPSVVSDKIRSMLNTADPVMVVVEPVLGSGGIRKIPDDYMELLASFCEERDALFVVDDITTGLWRTGSFYSETPTKRPPIRIFGKGLTAGLSALSALAIPAYVWERVLSNATTWRFPGTTHSGGPAACAAAVAVIDFLEDPDHVALRTRTSAVLREGIASAIDGMEGIELTGTGHMYGVTYSNERREFFAAREGDFVQAVTIAAIDVGLLLHPLSSGTIPVMPPLVINEDEIMFLCERLQAVLRRC